MIYNLKSNNYRNFKVIQEGRLPSRAYFIPFSSKSESKNAHPMEAVEKSDRVVSLNGKWDFAFFQNGGDLPKKINTEKLKFTKLSVPSCWQMKGFEPPVYVNERYLFNCRPPVIPTTKSVGIYNDGYSFKPIRAGHVYNSAGIYRRLVDIKRLDKTYILSFFGVSSCLELYINGERIGYSESSHNTSEFDISSKLFVGTNEIVVVVRKWCNGSYLECQDMFRSSGIFRDVLLFMNNKTFVYDFEVKTLPLDDKGNYQVRLLAQIKNYEGYKLQVGLQDKNNLVYERLVDLKEENTEIVFEGKYEEYSAEIPVLYKLIITLIYNETITESICKRIGFKRVEISNGVFLFNGKPIKIKGVNHHDTHPRNGYYLTNEEMLKDISIMKEYNINTVRTSHYPPHPLFIELCDIMGLYVIAEANIETHGTRFTPFFRPNLISKKKKWKEHYLDRVERMFNSLKNQPSIIMWSLGNESGGILCQDYCYDYLKKVSSIPVHYEGASNSKRLGYDVFSVMYPQIKDLFEYPTKGFKGKDIGKMPIFLCEYAHAMGTGPGSLKEYMDIFLSNDRYMGGCIWEFCDHAINHVSGKYAYTYGGDHGEFIHDNNFCVDGLFSPEREPHEGAKNMKYVFRPLTAKLLDDGNLEIFNTNFFKDSSNIIISLCVYWEGKERSRTKLNPNILPRQSRKFDIFVGHVEGDMFLNVVYTDKETGKTIAKEQLVINEALTEMEKSKGEKLSVKETADILTINFENGYIRIDKNRGALLNYIYEGKDFLAANPSRIGTGCFATNILRPFTDNDRPRKKKAPEMINVVLRELSYKHKENENIVELQISNAFYIGDKESYVSQDMLVVYPSGKMEVYSTLHPRKKKLDNLKCFGKIIKMPLQFNDIIYYGRGEGENYPDMCEHAPIGIYERKAEDFAPQRIRPQEGGNRCETRYALARNKEGQGLMFLALAKPFNFNVRMHPKWKIDRASHIEDLGESDGIYVHIDAEVSGLGSASCMVDTLPKYKIQLKESYVMGFAVVPFSSVNTKTNQQ